MARRRRGRPPVGAARAAGSRRKAATRRRQRHACCSYRGRAAARRPRRRARAPSRRSRGDDRAAPRRAVLLRGEPGIGKSRLLDAAAALAREAGAVVLEAARTRPNGSGRSRCGSTRCASSSRARPRGLRPRRLRKPRSAVRAPRRLIAERASVGPWRWNSTTCSGATSRAQQRSLRHSNEREPTVLGVLAARATSCATTRRSCGRCASCAMRARSRSWRSRRSARTPCARSSASRAASRHRAPLQGMRRQSPARDRARSRRSGRRERPIAARGRSGAPVALRSRRRRGAALGRRAGPRIDAASLARLTGLEEGDRRGARNRGAPLDVRPGRPRPALLARADRAQHLRRHLARAPAHDAPSRRRAARAGHGARSRSRRRSRAPRDAKRRRCAGGACDRIGRAAMPAFFRQRRCPRFRAARFAVGRSSTALRSASA